MTIGNFCSDELVVEPNESVSQVTSVAKSGESWCRPFIIEVTINDKRHFYCKFCRSKDPSVKAFAGSHIVL